MPMYRARVSLDGFPGAPGLNTWWFKGSGAVEADANRVGGALRQFYESVKNNLVSAMSVNFPGELDTFDEATGILSGSVSSSGPESSVTGTGVGTALSRATQMKLRFLSGAVSDGRRVQGGIYLGPIHSGALTNGGAIQPPNGESVVVALQVLRTSLTGNVQHAVYRQPRPAAEPGGARPGAGFLVTGYGYKELPAVIRSRRD